MTRVEAWVFLVFGFAIYGSLSLGRDIHEVTTAYATLSSNAQAVSKSFAYASAEKDCGIVTSGDFEPWCEQP